MSLMKTFSVTCQGLKQQHFHFCDNSNLKTLLIQVQLLLLPQLDLQVNLQTGVTVCMVSRGTRGLYPIHTTTHACAPQNTTSELSPPTEPLISL